MAHCDHTPLFTSDNTRTLTQIEAHEQAVRDMLGALKEIDIICNESRADLRKRMGTRIGNSMTIARAAIARAEAAGIK